MQMLSRIECFIKIDFREKTLCAYIRCLLNKQKNLVKNKECNF